MKDDATASFQKSVLVVLICQVHGILVRIRFLKLVK